LEKKYNGEKKGKRRIQERKAREDFIPCQKMERMGRVTRKY